MNFKQWVWIYYKIKDCLSGYAGRVPDHEVADRVTELYLYVMETTEKSRNDNPEIDEQLHHIMNYVFDIIHSLEAEGKAI